MRTPAYRTRPSPASEIAPAIAMPLTFSMPDRLRLGLICYALMKLAAGMGAERPPWVTAVAAPFALKFASP